MSKGKQVKNILMNLTKTLLIIFASIIGILILNVIITDIDKNVDKYYNKQVSNKIHNLNKEDN